MTERFTFADGFKIVAIKDNGQIMNSRQVCELLNELHEENIQLKRDFDSCSHNWALMYDEAKEKVEIFKRNEMINKQNKDKQILINEFRKFNKICKREKYNQNRREMLLRGVIRKQQRDDYDMKEIKKDIEHVLNCLEKACNYAIKYDHAENGLVYNVYGIMKDNIVSEEKISSRMNLANTLASDERHAYDFIRDNIRFKKIMSELQDELAQ